MDLMRFNGIECGFNVYLMRFNVDLMMFYCGFNVDFMADTMGFNVDLGIIGDMSLTEIHHVSLHLRTGTPGPALTWPTPPARRRRHRRHRRHRRRPRRRR